MDRLTYPDDKLDAYIDLTDQRFLHQEAYIENAYKGSPKLRDAVYTCRREIIITFFDDDFNTIYVENPFNPFDISINTLPLDFKLRDEDDAEDSLRIRDYAYQSALYSLFFDNYLDENLSFEEFSKKFSSEVRLLLSIDQQPYLDFNPNKLVFYRIIESTLHNNQVETPYGIIDAPIRTWVSRPAVEKDIHNYIHEKA